MGKVILGLDGGSDDASDVQLYVQGNAGERRGARHGAENATQTFELGGGKEAPGEDNGRVTGAACRHTAAPDAVQHPGRRHSLQLRCCAPLWGSGVSTVANSSSPHRSRFFTLDFLSVACAWTPHGYGGRLPLLAPLAAGSPLLHLFASPLACRSGAPSPHSRILLFVCTFLHFRARCYSVPWVSFP